MSREELIDPSENGSVFDGEEESHEFTAAQDEPVSRPGRASATFLFLLGFSILAGGLALTFAPEYSWRATKVVRQLDALGFHNGTFVMGGLILFGLGMVARSRAAAPKEAPQESTADSDFLLVADQLATDMARMNTSLLQIQGELGGIEEAQKSLAQKGVSDTAELKDRQNALFGIAASLDRVGARMEEQFERVDAEMRSSFAALEERMQSPASVPAAPALELNSQPTLEPQVDPVPSSAVFVEPELTVKMPESEPFVGNVDEPASALPAPEEPADPSQEVFEAFEGLEQSADKKFDSLLPDEAIRRALGDD